MGFLKDFKAFAMRGNIVDMAVGIVIGAAFGKIVSSFVKDILMPPIGILMGGVDFKTLGWVLQEAVLDPETQEVITPAITMTYGNFIQTLLDFIIIALAIFMVVKAMIAMKKKEEAAPAAPPAPSKEELLLTEIRDLLKKD
ncbi:MAG: large conductance mechanosensitive channel protein MscL [Bacteroidetes bacterium]|nr:MAG: large conductance mechanosensitive channel protein MscL [Bacteroidota bacterium]